MMSPTVFFSKVLRRLVWLIKGRPVPPNLLEAIWPPEMLSNPPKIEIAEGYRLRQFHVDDTQNYYDIFERSGIGHPPLHYWERHCLPDGFFVIDHIETNTMVGAILAAHHPTLRHPCAGHMAWMAVDPAHRGHHLGRTLSSAVTARLLAAGYKRMYIDIPEDRLTAMRIHLSIGWTPYLYLPEMEARWEAVCKEINWPITPEKWIRCNDPGSETLGFRVKEVM